MSKRTNPDSLYQKAEAALANDDLPTAEQLLHELVIAQPTEPLFHWRLGYILNEQHKFEQAVEAFQQALDLDPENMAALGCLGITYMELGQWNQAEAMFKKRLALKESPQQYVFLTHVLIQQEKYQDARNSVVKALALDPKFEEAYLNLGLVHRHQRHFEEAVKALQTAVQLDPNYAEAFRELGLAYYMTNTNGLALQALERCLELNPADAWAHYYLALCLEQIHDVENAGRHHMAAVKNAPESLFFQKKCNEFFKRTAVETGNPPNLNGT